MEIRRNVNVEALANWHSILFGRMYENKTADVMNIIPDLTLQLEHDMLAFARCDKEMHALIVSTWALAYLWTHRHTIPPTTTRFSKATTKMDCALLCAWTHDEEILDTPTAVSAPLALQTGERAMVLPVAGLNRMFARVHAILYAEAMTTIPTAYEPLVQTSNTTLWVRFTDYVTNKPVFTPKMIARLESIFCYQFITDIDVYTQPLMQRNFETIDAADSLTTQQRYQINALLFDHEPKNYTTETCSEAALGVLYTFAVFMCGGVHASHPLAILYQDELFLEAYRDFTHIIWLHGRGTELQIAYICRSRLIHQDVFILPNVVAIIMRCLSDLRRESLLIKRIHQNLYALMTGAIPGDANLSDLLDDVY